ncbi:MAG: hypothetical protein KF709_08725 [Gemmatimonadaceae bacterium]|nr:hypothetical protein [Gemmatimonadaceae bacterium]
MPSARVYVLDPATGAIDSEPIPVPAANRRALHMDADGTWWVALGGPGLVARRSPAGDWVTHDEALYAHCVARDASGVWDNGRFTGHPRVLMHVNATPGATTRAELPAATPAGVSPIPHEVRTGPGGRFG